ncbi:MAG: endonuclease Q family protein [Nanoarchaeota archaeon]|nr:endonuclease Q family protein [Nanoarchaeota archaeon]
MGEISKWIIGDLHIHSKYSRATSKNLSLEELEKWARIKGIGFLGTGDFTHPLWLKELKEKLKEKDGILYSQNGFKFILSGEISLIYTQGRGRRIHLLMLAPSFEVVDKINSYLDTLGRRDYDGRPIFKVSCENFTKKMYDISEMIEVIPAHIFTPWFGLFGSMSGFDSIQEAFGSQSDKIHAIETGISSDPNMNLRLKQLQNKTIVSFSDSHSFWPWRLGREATIFSSANSYEDILNQIRENKIIGTIETDPRYGMYHYDGHDVCKFSVSPEESEKIKEICSVCSKHLTVGVDHRVKNLADFPENYKSDKMKKVFEILPLHEIISTARASSLASKKTWEDYDKLIDEFKTEFNVLLEVPIEKLIKVVDIKVAELIIKNRQGKINVRPGYDGVYGEMLLEEKQEKLF